MLRSINEWVDQCGGFLVKSDVFCIMVVKEVVFSEIYIGNFSDENKNYYFKYIQCICVVVINYCLIILFCLCGISIMGLVEILFGIVLLVKF